MVNSIPRATNVDDSGIGRWEKSVTDVNDVDEKFANARDLGYMRLNYARVSTVGQLAEYDTVDMYKIQVQSNGKLSISLRSGAEDENSSVLDLSSYQQKLDELKKQLDPEGYEKEQEEKAKEAEKYGLLGENGEGLQIQVYMVKNGKEVLIGDTTAEKGSDEYTNMEQLLNGEYKAKKGEYYFKISRTEDYDEDKSLAYVMQIKQGEKYKHDYVTTESVSDDTKNKTTSKVPSTTTSSSGALSSVNALAIQATKYQATAQMLEIGYQTIANLYSKNSKF